jgi:hypothetical protein
VRERRPRWVGVYCKIRRASRAEADVRRCHDANAHAEVALGALNGVAAPVADHPHLRVRARAGSHHIGRRHDRDSAIIRHGGRRRDRLAHAKRPSRRTENRGKVRFHGRIGSVRAVGEDLIGIVICSFKMSRIAAREWRFIIYKSSSVSDLR